MRIDTGLDHRTATAQVFGSSLEIGVVEVVGYRWANPTARRPILSFSQKFPKNSNTCPESEVDLLTSNKSYSLVKIL
jgi:hypothetical protein